MRHIGLAAYFDDRPHAPCDPSEFCVTCARVRERVRAQMRADAAAEALLERMIELWPIEAIG